MSNEAVHLVFMGVAGCGKTTAAQQMADFLKWPAAEADDFHPQANIDKMSAGTPLTDEDRWPWLRSIRDWMSDHARNGQSTIVTCSALKRSYRDLLRESQGRVFFVHLTVPEDVIRERMATRDHFMKPNMLPSQFATLEDLESDEDGVVISTLGDIDETFNATVNALREQGLID